MSDILSIIWLAFAVSLDSFSVGTTYGMRKMKIPLLSTVIIACCSGVIIFLSMKVEIWLSCWFNPNILCGMGASILIVLGCWTLVQAVFQGKEGMIDWRKASQLQQIPIWTFEIRYIGLVIQVLKTPMAADMDGSGTINGIESFLLGLALSVDVFGVGLGMAMMGLPTLPMALTIVGTSLFCLRFGMWIGFLVSGQKWIRFLPYAPGICLIIIGLTRFF